MSTTLEERRGFRLASQLSRGGGSSFRLRRGFFAGVSEELRFDKRRRASTRRCASVFDDVESEVSCEDEWTAVVCEDEWTAVVCEDEWTAVVCEDE